MKETRILVFASYFAPNNFSEALTNNKFVLALVGSGYHVTVITTSEYPGQKYEDKWSETWSSLKPITINVTSINKENLLSKLKSLIRMKHPIQGVSWAYKAYKIALKIHSKNPFDIIISRSISDFGHLPALKFKSKFYLPWIANWNDPPYFLFPPPYKEKKNIIKTFFYKRYLKLVAKEADLNTFPCERLYIYLKNKMGTFEKEKIKIIPHLSVDLFKNKNINKNKNFTICHAGNLSGERQPDLFFKSLKKFCNRIDNNIQCIMIGVEDVDLQKKIKEYNLENIIKFTGVLTYEQTITYLKKSSIGLLIEAKCDEGIFYPSKVSDYMSANLPIMAISPENGTMRDMIELYDCGIFASNNDEISIYKAIEKFYFNWIDNNLNKYISKDLKEYLSVNYLQLSLREFISKI